MIGSITARLPRRTVQLRLTMLYVGLFLASAACLLVITYFLTAQRLPSVTMYRFSSLGNNVFISSSLPTGLSPSCPGLSGVPSGALSAGALPQPQQVSACMNYLAQQNATLRSHTLSELLLVSGIALGIMAIASVGLGWLMAGRVLSPLRTITATARRVSARNLHERIAMTGPDDELKELGDTFDQLLGRLEASFRAQRQFVANASHELRTPLARQRTLLEVALRDEHPTVSSLRTACERALAAGEQHERLIAAMITLARGERGLDRFDPFDLADIAEDALLARDGLLMADDSAGGARGGPDGGGGGPDGRGGGPGSGPDGAGGPGGGPEGPDGPVVSAELAPAPTLGDPGLAERLIANLLDNAIRYNEPGGQLTITTGMRGGRPFLAVSNSGPPVPADQLGRLFQPFQRMSTVRGATAKDGLGLGLTIVSAIAVAHGAELRARPREQGGLDIEIVFPAKEPPLMTAASAGGRTIS